MALPAADDDIGRLDGTRGLGQDNSLAEQMARLFMEKLNVCVPSEDTDLIEGGLLDSLALVELLFEIERVFGVTLPLEELEVDSLRTTRRIGELVRQVQDPKDP